MSAAPKPLSTPSTAEEGGFEPPIILSRVTTSGAGKERPRFMPQHHVMMMEAGGAGGGGVSGGGSVCPTGVDVPAPVGLMYPQRMPPPPSHKPQQHQQAAHPVGELSLRLSLLFGLVASLTAIAFVTYFGSTAVVRVRLSLSPRTVAGPATTTDTRPAAANVLSSPSPHDAAVFSSLVVVTSRRCHL